VEHPPRLTSVGLVFSTRLTQIPLTVERQRAKLARSVALPILGWPNHDGLDSAKPELQSVFRKPAVASKRLG
jgi:hypothetical protein